MRTFKGLQRWFPLLATCLAAGGALLTGCVAPRDFPVPMNTSLLGSAGRETVVLEVDHVPGVTPDRRAVELVRDRLEQWAGKPVAVEWGEEVPEPRFEGDNLRGALWPTVMAHGREPGPGEHRIYVLYARTAPGVNRGVAWSPANWHGHPDQSVVLMLGDRIARDATLWVSPKSVEQSVLLHEVGHVCGLVRAADHRDDDGIHCTRPGCRMYHGIDPKSVLVAGPPLILTGRVPLRLCRWCRRDLEYGRR